MYPGITQVTCTGNQFAEINQRFLKLKKSCSLYRRFQPWQEECGPSWNPSGHTLLASSRKDAAAQREAQEGDLQGQEGAEASHAGGPAADHYSGAAHAGRGRALDRGVCVRGHAPHHHRVSPAAGCGPHRQGEEAREGDANKKWLSYSEMFMLLSCKQEHPVFSGL
ncbi:single-pass membrane and coiled-coil domain-containing protein 4 isoform X3 [Homo sapiens]|uniref:single-pass membrane and coiled-coil domain-containing protein 4 isoform X3 n=1 Tax=Homo sapiens TaxID=9606 RepID=UPI0005D0187D|nr:single-pass membrane and coiled-coil domain-containing protein 4 isoform X3 [Homo sapiens]XP_016873509.1 single-pass membrane and coiled-coil domain-containing protein 4 isoform X3 [Homo sapiens]|eukprot:XP_011541213.1 single-pass membrane and coiled-coil domain-containing protein 4 isoform X5 [Homo sapiens]